MRPQSGYLPVEANAPLRGLATAYPSTRVPPENSPALLNVVVRDGVARRRTGYLQLGNQLDGIVMGITEFGPIGETASLVVFTSLAQYRYDTVNNVFIDISIRQVSSYPIVGVDTGAKEFDIADDHTSEFVAGIILHVVESTGNNGDYTVVSSSYGAPNTTIIVTEAIPDDTVIGSIEIETLYPVTGGNQGSKQFTVATDVTAIFVTDAVMYVQDSTSNDGTYTVASSSFGGGTTTITVVESIPTAVFDGDIVVRDDLATADTDYIDYQAVTDLASRRIIMTNGLDSPIRWSGETTKVFLKWAPTFANFVTCDTLAVFKEHLFLGGVFAAADEPQTIAWSDAGDFDNFTTGTTGVQVLYELVGGIKAMEALGDRLVVFSPDAIANGVFVGLPIVFAYETIIPEGTRLISPKSIASINVGLVYASEENFYLFDGSRGLRSLADVIRNDYKAVKDQANLHRVAALNDYSKKTIYFAIPDIDGGSMIYTLEYDAFDLGRRTWAKEKYNNNPRAFGFFTNASVVTWDDTAQEADLYPAGMPWSEEAGIWGNEGEQVDFPVRVFGDENGFVYIAAESVFSDNGTTADGFYDTIDFTVPQEFLSALGRWGEIEFEAGGGTVDVYTSDNLGGVYTLAEQVVLDSGPQVVRIPIDITSRTLRVRFEFTSDFLLRWIRLWVKPGASR